MRVIVWLLAAVLITLSGSALAGGAPCSGSRGGVVGCDGESFMCADGAVSGSKKSCQASEYVKVAPVVDAADVLANKPEKQSYTIISWIVGALAVLVAALVLVVWSVSRWVLRYYNAHAKKVNV